MPRFEEHIQQVKRNISFFESIHSNVNDCLDWQVTSLFYTALHLVSAHLSKFDQEYRNHNDSKNAINCYNTTSTMRIDEVAYKAYLSLENVSRKARYLVEVKNSKLADTRAHFIYEKHLSRALRNLDILMKYFDTKYTIDLPYVHITKCKEFTQSTDVKFIRKIKQEIA